MPVTTPLPLTLLWLVGLDHASGMRHGGNLRWFNLSRELLARGHTVYFGINGAAEASDRDAAVEDAHVTALADQALDHAHHRALAEIVGVGLEGEPEHSHAPASGRQYAIDALLDLTLVGGENLAEHRHG